MAVSFARSELSALIGLFYQQPAELGVFHQVSVDKMPEQYRKLLAHEHHMTVTVERYHRSLVNVQVLDAKSAGTHYERRILLSRQTDGAVVQFGIVLLNFEYLGPDVRREIESRTKPLGRVLIEHQVMREIELLALWRVKPGPDLRRLFASKVGEATYGRTAIIHCNGEPAVELLEIVASIDPLSA